MYNSNVEQTLLNLVCFFCFWGSLFCTYLYNFPRFLFYFRILLQFTDRHPFHDLVDITCTNIFSSPMKYPEFQ